MARSAWAWSNMENPATMLQKSEDVADNIKWNAKASKTILIRTLEIREGCRNIAGPLPCLVLKGTSTNQSLGSLIF